MPRNLFIIMSLVFFTSVSVHAENIKSKVNLSFTKCTELAIEDGQYTYDKTCIEEFYNSHPMTSTTFKVWQDVIKKPINERLVDASPEMIQYMILDNLLFDFPYENIQPVTDKELITAAQKALNELPTPMRKYIDEHFYGFMLVSGVGWTGFASSILESADVALKPGAVIIINADNIKKTLNDWLVFREKTTFQNSKTHLRMNYTKGKQPSTLSENLRHFLIHETAHLIVNAVPSIHPAFKYRNKPVPFSEFEKWVTDDAPLSSAFPFLTTSWLLSLSTTSDGENAYLLERNVPKAIETLVKTKKIKFYSTDETAKFTDEEAANLYKQLNKTCFPSLYSMVDYSEDFAETVTHYFMSYKEGYRYKVELVSSDSGKVITKFKDDLWTDSKCKEKMQFMNELFAN